MKIDPLCEPIRLILSDVDGVLTDGRIVFDNQGIESKNFHVRDGLGIRLWTEAGFRFGIITSRSSHIVKVRCDELGIDLVRQGLKEKLPVARKIMDELHLQPQQVAYIGDDLPDLAIMNEVGLAIAVADAADDVVAAAQLVTKRAGGQGAVREAIETILKSKKRWKEIVRKFG